MIRWVIERNEKGEKRGERGGTTSLREGTEKECWLVFTKTLTHAYYVHVQVHPPVPLHLTFPFPPCHCPPSTLYVLFIKKSIEST